MAIPYSLTTESFTLTITFSCFQYTRVSVFIAYTLSDYTLIPNISIPRVALFWKLSYPSAKMTHHQHAVFSMGEPTGSFIWNLHMVIAFQWVEFKSTAACGETKLNSFLPFSSTASTLAPFPKSSWTTTVSPFLAATCRGLWRQTNW